MTDIMEDLTLPPPCKTIDPYTTMHYRIMFKDKPRLRPVFDKSRLPPRDSGLDRTYIVRTATFTPANANESHLWSQEAQRFQPEEMARVAKEEADAKLCRLLAMPGDEYMAVLHLAEAENQARNMHRLEYKVWMAGQVAGWRNYDYEVEKRKREYESFREIHGFAAPEQGCGSTVEELQVDDEDVLAFTDEQAVELLESMRATRLAQETDFECFEVMTPDQTQHPEAQEAPPVDAPEWTPLDFLLTEQQQELVERVQERKRRENILRTGLLANGILTRVEQTGIWSWLQGPAEVFMGNKRKRDTLLQELNRL